MQCLHYQQVNVSLEVAVKSVVEHTALTTDAIDQPSSNPFSAVTGSKMRTAIANMPADRGAWNSCADKKVCIQTF